MIRREPALPTVNLAPLAPGQTLHHDFPAEKTALELAGVTCLSPAPETVHGLTKNFSHKDILNPLGMGAILLAAFYVRFPIINIVTLEIGACFSKAFFCSQSFPVRREASGSYLHRLHTWAQVWMGSWWGTNRSHTLTPEKRPCPLSSLNMAKEWNCAGRFY